MSILAASLDITIRSVMDATESLGREGMVTRHNDPSDRRAVLASITPAGRNALRKAHRARKRVMDQIFGGLTADENTRFLALLAKIRATVTDQ